MEIVEIECLYTVDSLCLSITELSSRLVDNDKTTEQQQLLLMLGIVVVIPCGWTRLCVFVQGTELSAERRFSHLSSSKEDKPELC